MNGQHIGAAVYVTGTGKTWCIDLFLKHQDGMWIAYDETQANELGRFKTENEALGRVMDRIDELEKEGYE